MKKFDSTTDTLKHIRLVQRYLNMAARELMKRGEEHDNSKLESPEKQLFDELTPILKGLTYGTPEYKESLSKLGPALEHHYANNSHHPEFYPNDGIHGMNLFDVMEMFFDWLAATKRTEGGNILKSIEINQNRFLISEQLTNIFKNTVEYYEKNLK